jgi:hypothetical protein
MADEFTNIEIQFKLQHHCKQFKKKMIHKLTIVDVNQINMKKNVKSKDCFLKLKNVNECVKKKNFNYYNNKRWKDANFRHVNQLTREAESKGNVESHQQQEQEHYNRHAHVSISSNASQFHDSISVGPLNDEQSRTSRATVLGMQRSRRNSTPYTRPASRKGNHEGDEQQQQSLANSQSLHQPSSLSGSVNRVHQLRNYT